jgi:integrase/recombinase XerD
MPKYNRCGQAEIFSSADYAKLFRQVKNPSHRLLLSILKYTGERIGAVCRLRVTDVYTDVENRVPAPNIFFDKASRKGSPDGTRESNSIPTNDNLAAELRQFSPPEGKWLFPSRCRRDKPVSPKSADKWFRLALERAGLKPKGYSLHSTRRTLVTTMARSGVPLPVIKKITGHKSMQTLQRYIQVDPEEIKKAVNQLPF